MRIIKKIRWSAIIIAIIVSCIFSLTRCITNSEKKKKVNTNEDFKKFAGSAVCANCHKDVYDKHIYTEHHLTSALPTERNILGNFEKGKNVFVFDVLTNVTMEKRDSGF